MNPPTSLVFSLAAESLRERRDYVPLRPGIEIAVVYRDGKTEACCAFLRYAAGAKLPLHRHAGHEHVLVIDGSQADESGSYGPGTLVVNPPGTSHRVWSPNGCLVLLIWEKPVVFVADDAA